MWVFCDRYMASDKDNSSDKITHPGQRPDKANEVHPPSSILIYPINLVISSLALLLDVCTYYRSILRSDHLSWFQDVPTKSALRTDRLGYQLTTACLFKSRPFGYSSKGIVIDLCYVYIGYR
jgi:hypothetical protein